MSRPARQGVDYFPLDVYLDNKIKFIEIKFGLVGFAVIIKILQLIYSQGYWMQWGEDEQLLFSSDNKLKLSEIKEITNEAIKREIFNPTLFEKYSILTSLGIQKRYKEIVRRRKDVDIVEDFTIYRPLRSMIDNQIEAENQRDDGKMSAKSQLDDGKSTQRKVKESKGKESKGNDEKVGCGQNPFEFYQNNFTMRTRHSDQVINGWIDDLSEELAIEAMKIAVEADKRNIKYVDGIIRKWIEKGIDSMDKLKSAEAEWERKKKGGATGGTNERDNSKDEEYDKIDWDKFNSAKGV